MPHVVTLTAHICYFPDLVAIADSAKIIWLSAACGVEGGTIQRDPLSINSDDVSRELFHIGVCLIEQFCHIFARLTLRNGTSLKWSGYCRRDWIVRQLFEG